MCSQPQTDWEGAAEALCDRGWHQHIGSIDSISYSHTNAVGCIVIWRRLGVDTCVVEKIRAFKANDRRVTHRVQAEGLRTSGLNNNCARPPGLTVITLEEKGEYKKEVSRKEQSKMTRTEHIHIYIYS